MTASATGPTTKRLHLRRPDRCAVCDRRLAVGDEAIWDRVARTVTCPACDLRAAPVADGEPGASALREYERRHRRREQRARATLGGLGALLARVVEEPETTRAWRQGGRGEIRVADRLAKHLDGHGIRLLHDRRIPGHGRANIDHIAIGPGGVTVIDTKTLHGKVRLDRIGGLFSPRRPVLMIGGRDRTRLIEGVERQVELVRAALGRSAEGRIDVRGALCFPDADGLPILTHLIVREIIVDGPRRVAELARRAGPLDATAMDRIWRQLAHSFPVA